MQLIHRFSRVLIIISLFFGSINSFAQSCNDRVQATAPDSRFQLSGSEVTDLVTGSIWQRCSVGQSWNGTTCSGIATGHTWSQALALSDSRWRLPNIKELSSIVELSCTVPAVNLNVFPETVSGRYWSSSPYAYDSGIAAWFVFFSNGGDNNSSKSSSLYVRLVRGEQ